MLNPRDNFFETLKPDGKPDRLVKQYESLSFPAGDPVHAYIRGERHRGMKPAKDRWGTTFVWNEGDVSAMPYITDETKAIKDICCWREFVKVPDIIANCSDAILWEACLESAAKVDRKTKLLSGRASSGVFERLHFLMGFEDTLVNFLAEPEAMHELCEAIGEYRFVGIKLICDYLKPDIFLSQDDWGSKTSLFMSPDIWREFIKPSYKRIYGYLKEQGVLVIHHSDTFLEPLVDDMVEIGVDVWQGALPQNDIPMLQKKLKGKLTIMGGIDAGIVDRPDSTETEIRAEVRRACEAYGPGGHFIPCITYGGPSALHPQAYKIIDDEIDKYNLEHCGICSERI